MSEDSGRIFLSHKSVDKAAVRDYKQTLELLSLKPWLDEDNLPAGAELHRALQKGMKGSCAAVFFVTPWYRDNRYIRTEINYAIEEKTQRGDDFSIITLVLTDSTGAVGTVPELLEPFVWKQPASPLQGLREIIRALPRPFRDIRPIPDASADPKVRVKISSGPGHITREMPSQPRG